MEGRPISRRARSAKGVRAKSRTAPGRDGQPIPPHHAGMAQIPIPIGDGVAIAQVEDLALGLGRGEGGQQAGHKIFDITGIDQALIST